ncbi:hypothetical protein [Paraburkholderia dilworthii]|uniref:Uncharacterized protein n=1 Tax=Paraburkholderia dilworthii TaxID=948106 RepID=A0ABW9DIH1_9BURK
MGQREALRRLLLFVVLTKDDAAGLADMPGDIVPMDEVSARFNAQAIVAA